LGSLEIAPGLEPYVAFTGEGDASPGHAFIVGPSQSLVGPPNLVYDLMVSAQADARTSFGVESPAGVAYQDGFVAVCDSISGDLHAGLYGAGMLSAGSAVWEGDCGSVVGVPTTSLLAMESFQPDAGDEVLFLDASASFGIVRTVSVPEEFRLSPLPLAASADVIIALGESSDSSGAILTIGVGSGQVLGIAEADGGRMDGAAVSSDGSTAYVLFSESGPRPSFALRVFDVPSLRDTQSLPLESSPASIAISADDQTVVVLEGS
jgi:hypothetical protein